jgi:hypothetical protein
MKTVGMFIFLTVIIGYINAQNRSQDQFEILEISINEYSEHLMCYFENKNDEIIYETINIYKNDNNIEMLGGIDSILIFFFYGIKTDDSTRYDRFFELVKSSGIERLVNIFVIINETNITEYISQQTASPNLNDVYWTLYFATGNVMYLDAIFNIVMAYFNETENVNYYLAARSAMWSISSNALNYFQIKEYVMTNDILNNEIKNYILQSDPNKIQVETMEFINTQRGKGIW